MPEFLIPLLTMDALIALVSLTALEIVLGIDNVIFIAILADKLPEHQRRKARTIGLLLAMVQRIVFLLLIGWIIALDTTAIIDWGSITGLVEPDPEHPGAGKLSVKELILLVGGVFLIAKSVREIHEKLEGDPEGQQRAKKANTFGAVLLQIILLDAVFSIDSVLTAVGLTKHIPIMVVAVVVSVMIMIAFAGPIANYVSKHPTIKMLALAILLMIGVLLMAEGMEFHFPRGYVYFGMAFALGVELLNIYAGKAKKTREGKRIG